MPLPVTAAQPQHDRRLQYELPKLVEGVRNGWIASSQAIAVVGALFAAGETALIPFVKTASVDPEGNPLLPGHAALFKCLLVFSYGAFLFNASATISSLILIDKLGEMAFLNRSREDNRGWVPSSANRLLTQYKLGGVWYSVQVHCLLSLILGCTCIFLQIVLYTWLKESRAVFVLTTIIAGWCALPFVLSITHSISTAYSEVWVTQRTRSIPLGIV